LWYIVFETKCKRCCFIFPWVNFHYINEKYMYCGGATIYHTINLDTLQSNITIGKVFNNHIQSDYFSSSYNSLTLFNDKKILFTFQDPILYHHCMYSFSSNSFLFIFIHKKTFSWPLCLAFSFFFSRIGNSHPCEIRYKSFFYNLYVLSQVFLFVRYRLYINRFAYLSYDKKNTIIIISKKTVIDIFVYHYKKNQ
jgi:hypothetical protein